MPTCTRHHVLACRPTRAPACSGTRLTRLRSFGQREQITGILFSHKNAFGWSPYVNRRICTGVRLFVIPTGPSPRYVPCQTPYAACACRIRPSTRYQTLSKHCTHVGGRPAYRQHLFAPASTSSLASQPARNTARLTMQHSSSPAQNAAAAAIRRHSAAASGSHRSSEGQDPAGIRSAPASTFRTGIRSAPAPLPSGGDAGAGPSGHGGAGPSGQGGEAADQDAASAAAREAAARRPSFCSRPVTRVRRSAYAQHPGMPMESRAVQRPLSRKVDSARLSGVHIWDLEPVLDMNYSRFVLNATNVRPDMKRFQEYRRTFGELDAVQRWRDFANGHPWFLIPGSLQCDRTFARDEMEVKYLDRMAEFIPTAAAKEGTITISDLPLLTVGDALLSRWWNRPRFEGHFVREAHWRKAYNLMIPFDSIDMKTRPRDVDALATVYPQTPHWWTDGYFPAGVPCPTPPSVFYFHGAMVNAQTDRERYVWETVLDLEFSLLYAATWWHTAARGHRAFILPLETIEWLGGRLGDAPIDPDTRFGPNRQTTSNWVQARMRDARAVPEGCNNVLEFPKTDLEPADFIWCGYGTGFPNTYERGGRRFERCGRGLRNIEELGPPLDDHGRRRRINRRQPPPPHFGDFQIPGNKDILNW